MSYRNRNRPFAVPGQLSYAFGVDIQTIVLVSCFGSTLPQSPHRFEFESRSELAKNIAMAVNFGPTREIFLYFYSVITEHDFEMIEREFKAAQLRSAVRFTFENPLNATTLRIMPRPEHYKVAYDRYTEIVYKTALILRDGRYWISAVGET